MILVATSPAPCVEMAQSQEIDSAVTCRSTMIRPFNDAGNSFSAWERETPSTLFQSPKHHAARWPGGPVARWPGGPVARWPGGLVAWWPGGPVARWPGGLVGWWPGGPVARWPGGPVGRWPGGPVTARCSVLGARCSALGRLRNFSEG